MTENSSSGFLRLFGLDPGDIEFFRIERQDNCVYINVRLNVKPHACPSCGTMTTRIKDYRIKTITHSVLSSSRCYIRYHARRYVCPGCGRSFSEDNPFTFRGGRISVGTVYNVLRDLKSPAETFRSVAERNNISQSTCIKIFSEHVDVSRRKMPRVLCIDEVYAIKSRKIKIIEGKVKSKAIRGSDYVCVLVDFISHDVVDIVESRRKSELYDYFNAIPKEERDSVEFIIMDMWKTYRDVARVFFPKSRCVADRFHVEATLTRIAVHLRNIEQNRISEDIAQMNDSGDPKLKPKITELENTLYLLKKFSWLILKCDDKKKLDPDSEKKYNKKLGQYLNYYDIYDMICRSSHVMDQVTMIVYRLKRFYGKCTAGSARQELEIIMKMCTDSGVPELEGFADTLKQWKQEILNFFHAVSTDVNGDEVSFRRPNNGVIENRNRQIKKLKDNASGFTNFSTFRNRVMYCLNSDATFCAFPIKNSSESGLND